MAYAGGPGLRGGGGGDAGTAETHITGPDRRLCVCVCVGCDGVMVWSVCRCVSVAVCRRMYPMAALCCSGDGRVGCSCSSASLNS